MEFLETLKIINVNKWSNYDGGRAFYAPITQRSTVPFWNLFHFVIIGQNKQIALNLWNFTTWRFVCGELPVHNTNKIMIFAISVSKQLFFPQATFNIYIELWRRKGQCTPVFFPGESHGPRSLVATVHGVTRIRHDLVTKPPPPYWARHCTRSWIY